MNSQNMNGINKLADYILKHPGDVVDFSLSLTDYNLDSNYVTYEITVRFPKNEKRLHENKKKSLLSEQNTLTKDIKEIKNRGKYIKT